MVITLGQQYNVGEKPTVILYTYINRHAGTPTKGKTNQYIIIKYSVVSVVLTSYIRLLRRFLLLLVVRGMVLYIGSNRGVV